MTTPQHRVARPSAQGLYDPAAEHDACGVAFVATLRGTPGRDIVDAGLTALLNLDHRGAVGAEENSGDGAGILTQIPDAFVRDVVAAELPPAGHYAIGMAFLPQDVAEADALARRFEAIAAELRELGYDGVIGLEGWARGDTDAALDAFRTAFGV